MYFLWLAQWALLAVGVLAEEPKTAGYGMIGPYLDTPWTQHLGRDPWPEYPRPQRARSQWKSLNGIWNWQPADGKNSINKPPLEQALDKSILVPSCIESGLSGISEPNQHFSWYKTSFEVPEDWNPDHRVLLNFGAVDYEATIFINGHRWDPWISGYFDLETDITKYVNRQGSNELLVFVWDPTDSKPGEFFKDPEYLIPTGKQSENPSHIFYTACTGIWQSVWIESAPNNYVEDLHVTADMHGVLNVSAFTEDLDNVSYNVTLWERVNGTSQTDPPVNSSTPVFTHECVSSTNKQCTIDVFSLGFTPKLWSPDSPALYNMRVQLKAEKGTGDIVHSYVGFRSLGRAEINGVHRPLLNGKFVFQFGTLDQGYWPDGIYVAPNRKAMESDLHFLKSLGFNMVRKHVKVEPALYYAACDTLGLLVMQDMPNFPPDSPLTREDQELFVSLTKRMVRMLRNYPSIASWVVYNEGWGQVTGDHVEKDLVKAIRELDPSGRLVNANSGWYDHGAGDFSDNHHYSSPQCGTPWASKPGMPYDASRIAVQGEFGGGGHNVSRSHLWGVAKAISKIDATYELSQSLSAWNLRAHQVLSELLMQVEQFACSAAVYTQTTDVEGEVNGLMTYDRRVSRVDKEMWKKDIQALYAAAEKRAQEGAMNPTPFLNVDEGDPNGNDFDDDQGMGAGWWGGASLNWKGDQGKWQFVQKDENGQEIGGKPECDYHYANGRLAC